MKTGRPDLTATIVSWNTRELLRGCLGSLAAAAGGVEMEVHVVDNASADGSREMVEAEFPGVKLFRNTENAGFARANNQSWREARGRYWLLLNSDAEARPEALTRLVAFMDERPRAGLATARLVNADGTPQYCACPPPSIGLTLLEMARLHKLLPAGTRGGLLLGTYFSYDRPAPLGWTWGTALIARREAVESVGPLSESFHMYGEDVEWSLRMRRRGWQVWFCPDAEVLHHGGRSSAQRWKELERARITWRGYHQAVRQARGPVYAALLEALSLAALNVECAASRMRRREASPPPVSWLEFARSLGKDRERGAGC